MLFDVDEDVLIGGGCVVVVVTCTCVVDDVVIGSTVVEDVLAKAVVDDVLVTGVDVVASDTHGTTGVLQVKLFLNLLQFITDTSPSVDLRLLSAVRNSCTLERNAAGSTLPLQSPSIHRMNFPTSSVGCRLE